MQKNCARKFGAIGLCTQENSANRKFLRAKSGGELCTQKNCARKFGLYPLHW